MVTFNPYVITNVQDGFSVQSNGYLQGDVLADPATRFAITGGVIAATDVGTPMWGGTPVFERAAPVTPANGYMGSTIGRAVNASSIAGFATFNGSFSLPTTPQSPVPMGTAGNSYNYVRVNTGNRLVLKCNAAVAAYANTANSLVSFSWDYVNDQLIPYAALALTPSGTSNTSTVWAGGVLTVTTAAVHGLSTGNNVTIVGAAPYNYNVSGPITVTSTTTYTIPVPGNPGVNTAAGATYAGLGGFNATLLEIDTNSTIVTYNSTTGFATWTPNSTVAVVIPFETID